MINTIQKFCLWGACFLFTFSACKKADDLIQGPTVPVTDAAKVAEMNLKFGWDAFKSEMQNKPAQNILISPWSIQTALAMAMNGAGTSTLSEMQEMMYCPGCSVADLNTQQAKLTTLLEQQSGHPTLKTANGYFYDDKRMTLKSGFEQAIETHFKAQVNSLNFDDESSSLQTINQWVKNSTQGKIDQILERISTLDVAFLINALYFKADWQTGFAPQLTHSGSFETASGQQVQVQYVNADRDFTFKQSSLYNLVDIPFRDSTYSLSLIQAGSSNPNLNWYQAITSTDLNDLYTNMENTRAIVGFPRMKLSYENDLISTLKSLGMQAAFSDRDADFKSMGTAGNNIFINQIKHKAVLEVDEKGAEGAAVTSIGFGVTSVPPTFYFNNAYILVLRHIATNTLIFTGFVSDPTN